MAPPSLAHFLAFLGAKGALVTRSSANRTPAFVRCKVPADKFGKKIGWNVQEKVRTSLKCADAFFVTVGITDDGRDHIDEFLVVDFTVAVLVHLLDDFIDLQVHFI